MFTTACTIQEEPPGSLDIVDEATIDLDLVERETLQIAQRGIAGAEIVQRDPHADAAQLMQNGERGVVIANQHRLGDLQLQPARREARTPPARATIFNASVPLLN